ncbi:GAF domain-containing protein [Syntrophomonas palmitatica]|uniref:GAF domain-containing protein n=1 Tax=Syntrophomonas palmitatica TaxID=402877 RepID=UPI001FA74308|nr:GAF domain-containing protein [Syntrophomonas palmitatica]
MVNSELKKCLEELDQIHEQIKQLHELIILLNSCERMEESYLIVSSQMQFIFPDTAGAVYLFNPEGGWLELKALWNIWHAPAEKLSAGECQAVRLSFSSLAPQICPVCKQPGLESEYDCLCIPMLAQGELLGLVKLMAPRDWFDENRLQLARTVVDATVLALSNLRMRKLLDL